MPWVQPLREIRHIRFSSMYRNVVPDTRFVSDIQAGRLPQVSWLTPRLSCRIILRTASAAARTGWSKRSTH
jgi:phospholipase C